jgi:hypothetical protein
MRNWRPYSSIARDGEKTVYCQRGNHGVYYGDAFVSFKPSKLIWCADCKDAFYEVKPTLFDELNSQTEEKKGGEQMSDIKRIVKSRKMVSPEGSVVIVHIKWSNNAAAAEAGRSWYLDIGGKAKTPRKLDGLPTAESVEVPELVRAWANNTLKTLGYSVHKG